MSAAAITGTIYVDGRLRPADRASVSALDRGFMLGDGLFETMRARGAHVLFLAEHLARLRAGAAVLDLPLPSDAALQQAIAATLRANALSEAVLRLTVTRGADPGRGLDPPSAPQCTLVIRATPFTPPARETYDSGVAAVVATLRRNETSPLARIKSCSYVESVLARREARQRGADEALLLNTTGAVACAAAANVAAIVDGVLHTPPINAGVLPGVTRRAILAIAAQNGLSVVEAPFALETLRGADEAFLTNTIMGVMPLTNVEGEPIGAGTPGPLTRRLAADYARLVESLFASGEHAGATAQIFGTTPQI